MTWSPRCCTGCQALFPTHTSYHTKHKPLKLSPSPPEHWKGRDQDPSCAGWPGFTDGSLGPWVQQHHLIGKAHVHFWECEFRFFQGRRGKRSFSYRLKAFEQVWRSLCTAPSPSRGGWTVLPQAAITSISKTISTSDHQHWTSWPGFCSSELQCALVPAFGQTLGFLQWCLQAAPHTTSFSLFPCAHQLGAEMLQEDKLHHRGTCKGWSSSLHSTLPSLKLSTSSLQNAAVKQVLMCLESFFSLACSTFCICQRRNPTLAV